MIVALMGLPGSGKTWLADQLQEHMDCVVLNRDIIRDSIFPEEDLDYSAAQNELAAQVTNQVAEYILARNHQYTVILDGRPLSKQSQREEIRDIAQRTGHTLKVIYCWAPDEVVRERLKNDLQIKKNAVANRDMKKYYRIKESFDPIESNHLSINTSNSFPGNLEQILKYLGRPA